MTNDWSPPADGDWKDALASSDWTDALVVFKRRLDALQANLIPVEARLASQEDTHRAIAGFQEFLDVVSYYGRQVQQLSRRDLLLELIRSAARALQDAGIYDFRIPDLHPAQFDPLEDLVLPGQLQSAHDLLRALGPEERPQLVSHTQLSLVGRQSDPLKDVLAGLRGRVLKDCRFVGCDFSGIVIAAPAPWAFLHTTFEDCNFNGAKAAEAIFKDCVFERTELGANFKSAHFDKTAFTECPMDDAEFDGAYFTHASFTSINTNAGFDRAFFGGSLLHSCQFRGSMEEADFTSAVITGVRFSGDLRRTDWQKAALNEVTFEDCALMEANFEHAADVSGLRISPDTRWKRAEMGQYRGEFDAGVDRYLTDHPELIR